MTGQKRTKFITVHYWQANMILYRSHPWHELLSISFRFPALFREKSMNILSLHFIGINVSNLQLMPKSTYYFHYGNGLHNEAVLIQQWVISIYLVANTTTQSMAKNSCCRNGVCRYHWAIHVIAL